MEYKVPVLPNQKLPLYGQVIVERTGNWASQFSTHWRLILTGLGMAGVVGGVAIYNPSIALGLAIMLLMMAVLLPRPAWIAYLIVLSYPFTGGLARGGLIPGLRISQAILVMAVGLLFLAKETLQGKFRLTMLDLAFLATLLTSSVFPVLAVFNRGDNIDVQDVAYGQTPFQLLAGPIQYWLLYRIVVAGISTMPQVKGVLNILFGTSMVVAVLGILQKAGVGPIVNFLDTYYPTPKIDYLVTDEGQRITSTMVLWAGLGAYLCLSLLLALVCFTLREQVRIHPVLLVATVMADTIALVLTGTMVAWVSLIVCGAIIFKLIGRTPSPKVMLTSLLGIISAIIIFMPFLQARFEEQLGAGTSSSLVPQSIGFRVIAWTQIFLPAIGRDLLFGAGPVPRELNYWPTEESQYLYLLLRGGIPNFLSYWFLIIVGFVGCWQLIKMKEQGIAQAVGLATFACLIAINIMNLTANYFTAFGPTQILWELLALVVAINQIKKLNAASVQVTGGITEKPGKESAGLLPTPTRSRPVELAIVATYPAKKKRLPDWFNKFKQKFDWRFLKDSVIVGVGSTLARLLGLVFQILLARFLTTDDFGFVRYSLTLIGIFTIVSAASPASMARFLAANPNDPTLRNRYYTTGLVGVAGLLGVSLIVAVPLLAVLNALDIGNLVSIVGLTGFFSYFAVVRGLSNAWKMGLSYVLTNLGMLGALFIVIGWMQLHSATVALVIYGLANLLPLILLEIFRPIKLQFRWRYFSKELLWELGRFSIPLIVANGAYTLWFGVDVLLVQNFTPQVAGYYAVAKTLAMAFVFVPSAIFLVLMPKVAALDFQKSKRYALAGVGVAFGVSVIGVIIIAIWGRDLIGLTFGQRYVEAQTPLLILSIGMTFYSVYAVLEGYMVGRGRPGLHAQAMTIAMLIVIGLGFYLTPTLGGIGSSLAFTLGAGIGLIVLLFNSRALGKSAVTETSLVEV